MTLSLATAHPSCGCWVTRRRRLRRARHRGPRPRTGRIPIKQTPLSRSRGHGVQQASPQAPSFRGSQPWRLGGLLPTDDGARSCPSHPRVYVTTRRTPGPAKTLGTIFQNPRRAGKGKSCNPGSSPDTSPQVLSSNHSRQSLSLPLSPPKYVLYILRTGPSSTTPGKRRQRAERKKPVPSPRGPDRQS